MSVRVSCYGISCHGSYLIHAHTYHIIQVTGTVKRWKAGDNPSAHFVTCRDQVSGNMMHMYCLFK